jgi:transposase
MVALVRAGRSAEELAKEFPPTAKTIREWAKQADRDEGRRTDGLTSASTPISARRRPKCEGEPVTTRG